MTIVPVFLNALVGMSSIAIRMIMEVFVVMIMVVHGLVLLMSIDIIQKKTKIENKDLKKPGGGQK